MSGSIPTSGNDSLTGSNGADAIDLLAGNDSYLGNGGNDSILGGDGLDTIYGGNGDDTILGGNDSDGIYGEAGNDSIDAGAGTGDSVHYNQGGNQAITATISAVGGNTGYNDARVTTASQGNDTIINFENIDGSGSNDAFIVNSAATSSSLLFVYGSSGNDTISVNTANNAVMANYNTGSGFSGFTRGVSVDLSSGADTLNPTGSATDAFGTDVLVNVRGVAGTSLADTIFGTNFDDRFRGYAGNDYFNGRNGSDLVDYAMNASSQAVSVNLGSGNANDGLGGTDTLISIEQVRATGGSDTLIGGNGNELLRGNGGNDFIDGGNGSDIADYSNNTSGQGVSVNLIDGRANDGLGGTDTLSNIEYVFGGSGNDTIIGGNGADSFWGSSGNDSLVGGDGADTLYGGSGNDTIAGGNGNEVIYGEAGNDTIDAGAGTFDSIRYNVTGADAIVATISLIGPNRGGSNVAVVAAGTQGFDSIINFEAINATGNSDTFYISDAATFYASLFLFGNTGNDTITSSADPYGPYSNVFADYDAFSAANSGVGFTRGVSVDLQTGNDSLGRPIGSATDYAGTDMLVGVRGIAATSLNDTIYGTAFDDRFRPYAGNDIMDGRDGFDMVDYSNNFSSQAVSVNLVTGLANDGRGGADTLISIENLRGGSGNDTLLGNVFAEAFRGLAGNDSIDGGLGSDRIDYLDTSATSGVSVNLITGTASDGRGGFDTFTSIENAYGSELNDYLVGVGQDGQATSRLRGDAGSDTLVGIDGEYVVADYGTQTVGLSVNLASGSVNDGMGGVDSLINIRGAQMYGNFADTLIGSNGDDWLAPSGGSDSIVGGNGFDVLSYGGNPTRGVSVNLATGTANDGDGGTDAFTGIEAVLTGYSNDTVIGDGGVNAVVLGAGADYADAAGGNDVVSYRFGFSPNAVAYSYSESGDGRLFSGVTIDLAAGRATDYGGSVDTILNFEYAEGSLMHDSILGSSSDNELDGWEGNDTIDAGGGNDILFGGQGNDSLMGGAGNDIYEIGGADGEVAIRDSSGWDMVSLSGYFGETIAAADVASASGIEAIGLGFGGNRLHLTAAAVVSVSDTNILEVTGGGDDRLVFDDTGWVRTSGLSGFETIANAAGGATVITVGALLDNSIASFISGGDGNDAIGSGNGNDTIDGGNGNDIIAAFGGNDSILGGNDADMIDAGDGADTVLGGLGNDLIQGGDGNDAIQGNEGADTLSGGNGADTLLAGASGDGPDSLAGGGDGDLYIVLGQHLPPQISDSGGNDTLSIEGTGIDFRLPPFLGSVSGIEAINLAGSGPGHILRLSSASIVALSDSTDELRVFGNGGDRLELVDAGWVRLGRFNGFDTLANSVGNATVIASVGLVSEDLSSFISGGSGNDVIDAGNGNDTIDGSNGNDIIAAFGGQDSIQGGNDADIIDGGDGADTIFGGDGNDTLDGGAGNDSLTGGAGNDVFIVNSAGDVVRDTAGTDTVLLRAASISIVGVSVENVIGDDAALAFSIIGNAAATRLTGGVLGDTILGYQSTDTVYGLDGNDRLDGGSDNDLIDGGNGADIIIGGTGDDTISGDAGTDALDGGSGNDILNGGNDADTLNGGIGADTLYANIGSDSLMGGADGDLYISNSASFVLQINDIGGNDTLSFQGVMGDTVTATTLATTTGIEAIDLAGSGNTLRLSAARVITLSDTDTLTVIGSGSDSLVFDDTGWARGATSGGFTTFTNGSATVLVTSGIAPSGPSEGNDTLTGIDTAELINALGGNDSVLGMGGNDTLSGGDGNDTLNGGLGNDSMAGGAGNDVFIVDSSADVVQDSSGTDTIMLRAASISIVGVSVENVIGDNAAQAFSITGNAAATRLTGGVLGDTILAYQNADTVYGLDGNDRLDGGSDNDLIDGGNGADTIIGGTGNDTTIGGLGNDSLEGGSGADHFIFNTALGTANVDRIQSYNVTDDTILLDDAIFTALGSPGALAAGAFKAGTAATDADDRIIYNATTGALFYDQDGNGATAAVQFATLTSITGIITNAEFLII